MQIEVTEIEPCKLKVAYQASPEQISNKKVEVLSAFKKAPVPGFRPGKASKDAIKYHYKNQIEESLKRALTEDAYHDTLFEKKIKPYGTPQFNSVFLGDGKFSCEFQLYTKPEFDLAEVKGLEVVKPHEPQDAVSVAEKMMQELRFRFGEVVPYKDNDFVQQHDSVIVDYVASIDGEKVEEFSAEGEMITIGKSEIPSFDENLLGMSLGETREFSFPVPDNSLPSLVGKTLQIKVTLNVGSKIIPNALDDSLAVKLGKKDFNELKNYVLGSAQAQITNAFKTALLGAISNRLVDMHQFDVPNWLSLAEARFLTSQSKIDWDSLTDQDKEKFLQMATRNVKLALILDKVRESEPEAQISDQEAFETIKSHLSKYSASASIDDIIKEMSNTGYLQLLFAKLKDEYTLDFIVKKVKIIE